MPNIYKTFTQADLDNKPVYQTSTTQNQKIQDTINKFILLFKAKHLS